MVTVDGIVFLVKWLCIIQLVRHICGGDVVLMSTNSSIDCRFSFFSSYYIDKMCLFVSMCVRVSVSFPCVKLASPPFHPALFYSFPLVPFTISPLCPHILGIFWCFLGVSGVWKFVQRAGIHIEHTHARNWLQMAYTNVEVFWLLLEWSNNTFTYRIGFRIQTVI